MRMVLQRSMVDQISLIMVKKILEEDLTVEEEIVLERNLTVVEEDLTVEEEMVLERNLTKVEEIILEEDLTAEVEMVLERNLIVVEEIILEEDLTVVENQPTKMVVGEVTRIILLINLEIRAIETVIENHHLKDSSI